MGTIYSSEFSRKRVASRSASSRFFSLSARAAAFRSFLLAVSLLAVSLPLRAQTELGVENDLTVLGTNGTALDPNVELKGFIVFGSTQAAYPGAVVGPGDVVVNGALAVSSGAYFTGVSTFSTGMYVMAAASFTDVANIYITGGADGQVLAKNGANGPLKWTSASALGDNLGNHTATQALNMNTFGITGAGAVGLGNGGTGDLLTINTANTAGTNGGLLIQSAAAGSAYFRYDRSSGWPGKTYIGNNASAGGNAPTTAITIDGTSGLNKVGIGTTAPATSLQVNTPGLALDGIGVVSSDGHSLGLRPSLGAGSYNPLVQNGDMAITYSSSTQGAAALVIAPWAAASSGIRMDGSGNVGIGVVNAGARLDAQAAGATAADMAQIWRKGDGSVVSSMSATGVLMAAKFIGDGAGLTGVAAGSYSGDISAGQVSAGTFPAGDYIFQRQVTATGYRAAQGAPYSADASTTGYSFGADGDTGMFSPVVGGGAANGILAFYANNSEAMRIVGGNVGISTITPGYLLTNVGNVRPIFGGPQTDQAGLAPAASAFVWGFDSYSGQAGYTAAIYNNRNCIAAGCGTALLVEAAYAYSNPTNALMTVNNGSGDVFTVRGSGSVGIGTANPNASALLDVTSTSKGLLPPRLSSAQRDAIVSPVAGLFVYNTTNTQLELYNGTAWVTAGAGLATGAIAAFASASCPAGWTEYTAARGRFLRGIDNGAGVDPDGTRAPGATQEDALQQHNHYMTSESGGNDNVVAFPDTNADSTYAVGGNPGARGDAYIWVGNIKSGRSAAETRPKNAAVIFCQFSGLGGGGAGAGANLVNGDIWVGNASNVASAVAVSGDATLSNAGVLAIANSAINSAKIADGAIMDADVNAAAAVAGTKISPNFGAQNIVTTGKAGVGTTSPDGTLTVQGSLEERDSGDAFRLYKNLASYNVSAANSAGTVKISLPSSKAWSNTMLRVVIKGYDYSGSGAWEVIVGGYNYTTGWTNASAEIRGAAPFSSVRLAHDGTANVILLGTTANNLQYPKIRVDEVMAGHNNYTGWGSGWGISQITSEAAITNVVSPALTAYALVNGSNASGTWPISISGTSAGAAPSGAAGGNLSGTYPNPSIASLPAISGAALTGLTAANISAGTAGISVTGNAATATKLNSQGDYAAATPGTTRGPAGLNMYQVYSNGYPIPYGNLLHMAGAGGGQLLLGWSGTDGNHADNYVRSKRDNDAGAWSPWAKILTDVNFNSYAPALTGTGASGTWPISISGTSAGAPPSGAAGGNLGGTYPNPSIASLPAISGAALTSLTGANVTGTVPNASYADFLNYEDRRTIAPGNLAADKLKFGFTSWANNNSAPYADFLHLRSYTDATGGNDNLVMFRKDAIGMRIWQQAFGSATAYAAYKDMAFTDGTNATGSWPISISGAASGVSFPAPAGDPAPVITARVVPAGQGAANEKSELILFHSNDPANGSGIDQITLRAPALSFQTYNDATVSDINNNLGYNERMYIDPAGNVGIGTTGPAAKLQVIGDTHIGDTAGTAAHLYLHGNGTANVVSTLMTTNGNLHLDAASGASGLYLNYYSGTGGVIFGNGAGGSNASVSAAGVFSGSGAGLSNVTANLVNGTYTGSGGLQPPSYIPSGQVRFNMMANVPGTSNYQDWLMMDTYTGADVPYVTMLGISKTAGAPAGYLAVGAKGGATWTSTPLITGSNIGSQSVNYAATANSLSGNNGKTGRESRLYRSDGETSFNYYIRHYWTANANGWRITASNDSADEQANIHRVSVDQADNSDTVDGYHGVVNQANSRYTTDFNSLLETGFYNGESTPANAPNPYGQLIVAKGIDTGLQIAGGYNSDNLYFRGWWSSGAGFSSWRTVIHNGNIGSQSVNYANTAGHAPSTLDCYTTDWGAASGCATNPEATPPACNAGYTFTGIAAETHSDAGCGVSSSNYQKVKSRCCRAI